MHTDLGDGERLLRQTGVSLQRGIEAVGGQLFLTSRRLIFEAHRFNVQTGRTVIRLADIEAVWKTWTRLFSLIPLVPNALAVATPDKTHRFIMFGRDEWVRLIRETQQDLMERDDWDDDTPEEDEP